MAWGSQLAFAFISWSLCRVVTAITLTSSSLTHSRHAVVEGILTEPNAEARVLSALQQSKVSLDEDAASVLRLTLTKLALPVPAEVRDLAAAAEKGQHVSAAEADAALKTLNKMLEEQRVILDHKVIGCREKRRSTGEAIQDAVEDVRTLASETSSARSIIVEASSRIPQDQRSFEEFKAEAELGRSRCKRAGISEKVKAKSLEDDAWIVGALRDALHKQCARGQAASLVQEPVDSAESDLHGVSAFHAERNAAMHAAGCPGLASALGVSPRKEDIAKAEAFLQRVAPSDCRMTKQNCAAMKDGFEEVLGEIKDAQARLRDSSAKHRQACKDEEMFGKSQLTMETSQASARNKELGEASWKAGQTGDLSNKKDSERQQLQKELKAITAKCTTDITDILYGKMCALQKVRDSLQILAGRTELPEDCQVTDWDEGVCSATCGGGSKTLTRRVVLDAKGGAACPPLTLNQKCGETACPKDCQISMWSTWSACSARCDGGVQERNRAVTSQPLGNGVACPHLVDMRLCNTQRCTSKCELLQWTPWTRCSKACDSGTRKRTRGLRDEGKASCPAADSKARVEYEGCNQQKCAGNNDVKCAGEALDVVLLLDASGSMTQEGFNAVKDLSKELVNDYSLGKERNKVAVAAFAKEATVVSALSDDAAELSSKIADNLQWLEGPSNAGTGLSRATQLLATGARKSASSIVLVVTDGRFVDPFLAEQTAERLKKNGVRLAFVVLGSEAKNNALLKRMASAPTEENVIQLVGLKELPAFKKWASKRIITSTCSNVV